MSHSNATDRAMRATYHPKGYNVSAGLQRARRPFRTVNAITGLIIAGFAGSVYVYSIRAVKQDDFSDVPLPSDAERAATLSIEDEKRQREQLKEEMRQEFVLGQASGAALLPPSTSGAPPAASSSTPSSAWHDLKSRFRGPIVTNAPPVDRIGTLSNTPNEMPSRRVV